MDEPQFEGPDPLGPEGADHLVAFRENDRSTGVELWVRAEDLLPA